jgi:pimeloyl-ACP methyl ester carboxylesterase
MRTGFSFAHHDETLTRYAMTEPQRRSMPLKDGEIFYLEWDTAPGAPVLVFAHANGFNALTYRSLLEPLTDKFRVVALDMRGHGRTTLPADRALVKGWRAYRDDLLRFVARLGNEPKLLAGHSLGASASLMAAAAKPDIARALVLVEPVLPPNRLAATALFAGMFGLEDRFLPLVPPAKRRRAKFASREAAAASFVGRGAFRSWPEAMIADYIEGGTVEDGEGGFRLACAPQWEATNFAIYPFNLASLGRRVRAPMTILYGTEHSTVPDDLLRRLVEGHARTRTVRVPGASHFLPMEKPDLVRAEILAAAERARIVPP